MRRKRKVGKGALWIMCALAVSLVSCEKNDTKLPTANDPIFRVDGEFDEQELSIVAGDDNAYMHTNSWEEHGVRVYSGNLSDGSLSIKMGIYDGMLDVPTGDFLNEIPEKIRFSRESSEPLAILSKDLFPNKDLISYVEWYVDDAFVGLNDYQISKPGKYNVCAFIAFQDGTNNQLCSELVLGYKKHGDFSVKHYLNQNGLLTAWADNKGYDIEKVRWYLDEVLIGEEVEISTQIGNGSYLLRGEVSFANGTVRSKTMLIDGSLSGKFIDDLTFFERSTIGPINRDFNLWIEIVKDGVAYHSENTNNAAQSITIESIEFSGMNISGNKTYKVKANINANLASSQSSGVKRASFDVAFGIEVP